MKKILLTSLIGLMSGGISLSKDRICIGYLRDSYQIQLDKLVYQQDCIGLSIYW